MEQEDRDELGEGEGEGARLIELVSAGIGTGEQVELGGVVAWTGTGKAAVE